MEDVSNVTNTFKDILNMSVGGFQLINILIAVLIFIVGALFIKFLLKLLKKVFSKTNLVDKSISIILRIIKIILYVILLLIVISQLGVDTTSLVAFASVISLGVTLALENVLGNVAGGLVILSTHPFGVNDYISSDGVEGTVVDIRLNHIVLKNANGEQIIIPNKDISSTKIINYTDNNTRRIVLSVTASYDAKTKVVFESLYEAMNVEGVLSNPKPEVHLTAYGESSIEYTLYCWVKWNEYFKLKHTINERIRDEFEKRNIEMTYNHLNVHMMRDI